MVICVFSSTQNYDSQLKQVYYKQTFTLSYVIVVNKILLTIESVRFISFSMMILAS